MRQGPYLFALLAFPVLPLLATPQAMNLKDVPDDARATIAKELARKKTQEAESADGTSGDTSEPGGGKSKAGCSMEVGSQSQRPAAQRRTITVISGPVVQICK